MTPDNMMNDGTRLLTSLPANISLDSVQKHLRSLNGLTVFDIITDLLTDEAWLHFYYCEKAFSLHRLEGDYWLYADDPHCNETVMNTVKAHFMKLQSAA